MYDDEYTPFPDNYPLRQELIGYCEDVLGDRIIACKKHKWACQRFLRDTEREGTDAFPYVFDEQRALDYFSWMRLFRHTKGPLAGKRKEPELIEKFIFGNIYGWVQQDTAYRRFRKAYWQVARKNAKSQDLAITALYEMSAFGESCAEVYIAATKKDQTRYVWEEALLLLQRCPELQGKFEVKYGEIKHLKSGSRFARMSQDDRKKGDGANPSCGILDEYHAHETTEYYDLLSSGMKTRAQPLLIIITTAGFDLEHPCYRDEYDYVTKLLDPDNSVENERYFALVNELDKDDEGNLIDDIKDEACWPKANPILVLTKEGIESIRDELTLALDKPEKMRDLLTKTFNVWVNQREHGYMNMAKWAMCRATDANPFPDVAGMNVWTGVDLSSTLDLTSASFEIPLPDGRSAVLSHSFIPEETLAAKRRTDKVPYDLWVKQGWITATPGAQVDYHYVLEYISQTYEKYGWPKGEVCFDRYLASWLMGELEARGFVPVDTPQGIPTLSEPTKDFRGKVYDGKIIHDGNPVLTWALSNAVTRENAQGCIMLDKGKSSQRIDPAAALMNAHVRAMANDAPVNVSEFADADFLDKLWG